MKDSTFYIIFGAIVLFAAICGASVGLLLNAVLSEPKQIGNYAGQIANGFKEAK